AAIDQFPDLKNLTDQVKQMRQRMAERLIREIEFRRDAGQHEQVYVWLSNFPDEGVAVEVLLKVRDMLKQYDQQNDRRKEALKLFEHHLSLLSDDELKKKITPMFEEIKLDLNLNTLDRMADFLRLANDKDLGSDAKLALAISGWLMGPGEGIENLAVAVSLGAVRDQVREYLTSENEADRQAILRRLRTTEGSAPANVARLISHMKPIKATVAEESAVPGLMQFTVPGLEKDEHFKYFIQLPPGYDPYRRYRCIVTLNGGRTSALQQIDWWAGAYHPQKKIRLGQAARHGCIVIAPVWNRAYQSKYMYSAREHAAVLFAVRDACQRFSIDTDRIFLSGHSMGGDAAWDIGLAHPDLWAGVIPIVARADKYVTRYWENGRKAAFYFIIGEMDGNSLANNARDFNRYLTRQGFDTMIVEYRGRGQEHFQDEIHRIFDWIRLHERNFFPKQFKAVSMRTWDNYFWWAELGEFPERSIVNPLEWPKARARPVETEGTIQDNNRIRIRSGTSKVTVWLSPEMVDFQERIHVTINGR
ncbi:MAG TPA: peptidase, partial [Planctomycetes bacterium]|nr:peptidase [Planctomycetota bacterium]